MNHFAINGYYSLGGPQPASPLLRNARPINFKVPPLPQRTAFAPGTNFAPLTPPTLGPWRAPSSGCKPTAQLNYLDRNKYGRKFGEWSCQINVLPPRDGQNILNPDSSITFYQAPPAPAPAPAPVAAPLRQIPRLMAPSAWSRLLNIFKKPG